MSISSILFFVIILIAVVSFIALWRADWQVGRAWEAVVAFLAAIAAAAYALWNGGVPS